MCPQIQRILSPEDDFQRSSCVFTFQSPLYCDFHLRDQRTFAVTTRVPPAPGLGARSPDLPRWGPAVKGRTARPAGSRLSLQASATPGQGSLVGTSPRPLTSAPRPTPEPRGDARHGCQSPLRPSYRADPASRATGLGGGSAAAPGAGEGRQRRREIEEEAEAAAETGAGREAKVDTPASASQTPPARSQDLETRTGSQWNPLVNGLGGRPPETRVSTSVLAHNSPVVP